MSEELKCPFCGATNTGEGAETITTDEGISYPSDLLDNPKIIKPDLIKLPATGVPMSKQKQD